MKDKIEKIEVNGEAFYVDYVGKKSKSYNAKEARTIDPLRWVQLLISLCILFIWIMVNFASNFIIIFM